MLIRLFARCNTGRNVRLQNGGTSRSGRKKASYSQAAREHGSRRCAPSNAKPRSSCSRAAIDAELEEEIRTHLEMKAADLGGATAVPRRESRQYPVTS